MENGFGTERGQLEYRAAPAAAVRTGTAFRCCAIKIVVAIHDLMPLRYVLEDERLMAIEAFEVLAVLAAVATFRGNRPALLFSYAVFGIHLCVAIFATYWACCVRFDRLI